jgi:ribosomal protein L31E
MADTIVTIRVRKRLVRISRARRTRKALDYVRESVAKISRVDPSSVRVDAKLNRFVMLRVARRMSAVKVKITKDGDLAKVALWEPEKSKAEQQAASAKTTAVGAKVQEKRKPIENKKAVESKGQDSSKEVKNK